jgi:ribosomal protein S18 acetylase RimI-like enzyme
MKSDLFNLISKYNSPEQGLLINTNVELYVEKLLNNSTILAYYTRGIKGFIAFYNNDKANKEAFLSMLLIDESLRGKGIGPLLLEQSIRILKNQGFENYKLEVLSTNLNAINLYKKYGFKFAESKEEFSIMQKVL